MSRDLELGKLEKQRTATSQYWIERALVSMARCSHMIMNNAEYKTKILHDLHEKYGDEEGWFGYKWRWGQMLFNHINQIEDTEWFDRFEEDQTIIDEARREFEEEAAECEAQARREEEDERRALIDAEEEDEHEVYRGGPYFMHLDDEIHDEDSD